MKTFRPTTEIIEAVSNLVNVINHSDDDAIIDVIASLGYRFSQLGLNIAHYEEGVAITISKEIQRVADLISVMNLSDQITATDYMCLEIMAVQSVRVIKMDSVDKKRFEQYLSAMVMLDKPTAESLIGELIAWTYPSYNPKDVVYVTRIGSLMTEWDYIKDTPYNDQMTRGEYMEKNCPQYVNGNKNTLCIIDSDGRNTYMRLHSRDVHFTCSDADRYVKFIPVSQL